MCRIFCACVPKVCRIVDRNFLRSNSLCRRQFGAQRGNFGALFGAQRGNFGALFGAHSVAQFGAQFGAQFEDFGGRFRRTIWAHDSGARFGRTIRAHDSGARFGERSVHRCGGSSSTALASSHPAPCLVSLPSLPPFQCHRRGSRMRNGFSHCSRMKILKLFWDP